MYAFDYQRPDQSRRRQGCRRRRRCALPRRRPEPDPGDAAAPVAVRAAGRPRRHRRPEGDQASTPAASPSAPWRRTPSVGARTPTCDAAIPALAELAGGIGDPMVRNMGTIGGSIANADPAACYPAAVLGLERDDPHRPARRSPPTTFFTGLYETALQPGELITAVALPDAAEGGLREVQAAGVAVRAGRRVRRPDRRRRAGRGDRRQVACVPGDARSSRRSRRASRPTRPRR